MRSSNVHQEIRLALEKRRPVLPLLAERITFPDEVRYALAGLQWVELLDRPTEDWLTQLLDALARLGIAGGSQPATGDRRGGERGADSHAPAAGEAAAPQATGA